MAMMPPENKAAGRPFDTPAMRALRDRLKRKPPNLDTLRVWNGNEGPTLPSARPGLRGPSRRTMT
jgi:hypothetical protein